jgi:hypothetical protein
MKESPARSKFSVATWRRNAIESFPALRRKLNDPHFTIYMLFFELLPMSREARRKGETKTLQSIYGFAAWCAAQPTSDINTAAAVAFYEHLFDEPELWEKVASYLSPEAIRGYWPLVEARLEPKQLQALPKFLGRRAP